MRFVLRALGTQVLIETDEVAFNDVKTAKQALVAMIGVEQKFDLVLENYADYERELHDLSLHQVLRRDLDWHEFQDDIARVSRRLANLLSAARLYLDQVRHDLRRTFGTASSIPGAVEAKAAEQYDARFGYRAMEALRNVMQHRSMPVHRLGYPTESVPQGVQFRAVPSIDVGRLKDAGLKATVLAEFEGRGESVNLTPLVRDYLEGLGQVHETLRMLSSGQVEAWDATLTEVHARGAEDANPKSAVLAMSLDADGAVVETVEVFTDLISYRKAFERRNRILNHLSRRFVSGADHDA